MFSLRRGAVHGRVVLLVVLLIGLAGISPALTRSSVALEDAPPSP